MMMITHRRVLDMYIVVAFFDESDSTLAMLVLYHPSSHSSPTGNLAIFSESSVFCGRARIVPKQTSLSLLAHFVHDEMKNHSISISNPCFPCGFSNKELLTFAQSERSNETISLSL